MLIVIDNYDSFTYNLVQCFLAQGTETIVYRHDEITVAELIVLHPSHLVISPGPGTPRDAGISQEAIQAFAGKIPILGVCLGHQCIAEIYGGKVVPAPQPMHGKVSQIFHKERTLFFNLSNPFAAARYHSLTVAPDSIPECLKVTAYTHEGIVMGLQHKHFCISGVQFHPESILTREGKQLLKNFLDFRAGLWE